MRPLMWWAVVAVVATALGQVKAFIPIAGGLPGTRVGGFQGSQACGMKRSRGLPVLMGLDFGKMMEKMTDSRYARARHILLEEKGSEAKARLEEVKLSVDGDIEKFSDAAREMSTCTSAANGGKLKLLARGETVPEFDEILFNEEPGKIYGPVETTYGTHLIYLESCNKPQNTWKMLFDDIAKNISGGGKE